MNISNNKPKQKSLTWLTLSDLYMDKDIQQL